MKHVGLLWPEDKQHLVARIGDVIDALEALEAYCPHLETPLGDLRALRDWVDPPRAQHQGPKQWK